MISDKTLSRRDLLAITFFLGFCSAIAQVLLIRELLTVFRGNEFIIGILFSAWFAGIFAGARLNPPAGDKAMERRIKIALISLPLVLLICIYLGHLIPLIFPRTAGTFYSAGIELLLSLILTAPAGFFVGFFFPPVVSLVSMTDSEKSGGNIYFLESAGSFTGGIIFSFIFVEFFNPIEIISILTLFPIYILTKGASRKLSLLLIIPLALLFSSSFLEKNLFQKIWKSSHTGSLAEYKRTRYQTVYIEESPGQVNVYGDGIYYYSLPDRYEARNIFHLIQSLRGNRKGRILLFGSGPGSLLYNLLKTEADEIYYFESDPELWELVKPYWKDIYKIKNENPKLKIVLKDLRHYLKETGIKFDMIICFPPAPENIRLNRFYTEDFYRLCRMRLKDKGIFITSMPGFANYISRDMREFIASIFKSFKVQFPFYLKTAGESIYLIGSKSKGILPGDFRQLIKDYRREYSSYRTGIFEKEITENFSTEELQVFFEESQLRYFDSILESIDSIQKNQDLTPRGYWDQLMLSAFQERSLFYSLLKGYMFFPALVILFTAAIMFGIKRRYGNGLYLSGFYIFFIGFASMSIMILMIIIYQNINGIIYHRISLINALFMLGLSIGSFTFNRKNIFPIKYIYLILSAIVILIYLYTSFPVEIMFWGLILALSLFCGAAFPVIFRTMGENNYHLSASILDSMDHLGSIAGAIITTLSLLPLMGIGYSLILIILILAAAGTFEHLKAKVLA